MQSLHTYLHDSPCGLGRPVKPFVDLYKRLPLSVSLFVKCRVVISGGPHSPLSPKLNREDQKNKVP